MNFSNNLQKIRKENNYSQEQLAEKIGVSRQSVSKWESGTSVPDFDKIVLIANIFDCSVDDLAQSEYKVKNNKKEVMLAFKKFAFNIALGVFLCVFSVALLLLLTLSFKGSEEIAIAIFMSLILVSVVIFIYNGITYGDKDIDIKELISDKEKERETKRFAIAISSGVSLSIAAVMFLIIMESIIPEAYLMFIFMLIIGVASFIFVYFGMIHSKIYEERQKQIDENRKLSEKLSGAIMLTAVAIYLYTGFVHFAWGTMWIVFPLGAILSAIISTILD